MTRPELRILTAVMGLMLFLLPACAPAPTADRTRFGTPDEAAKALMKGFETNNADELKAISAPTSRGTCPRATRCRIETTARQSPSPWNSPSGGTRLDPTAWSSSSATSNGRSPYP